MVNDFSYKLSIQITFGSFSNFTEWKFREDKQAENQSGTIRDFPFSQLLAVFILQLMCTLSTGVSALMHVEIDAGMAGGVQRTALWGGGEQRHADVAVLKQNILDGVSKVPVMAQRLESNMVKTA